jgi:formamidopyrimidine-DNA glycosylase
MPELPEVETVRRGLNKVLKGEEIASVEVLRPLSIGYPDAKKFAKALSGKTFANVDRRGKYLLINFKDGSGLAVHLRMSGRLLIIKGLEQKGKFLRVAFKLKSGKHLHFEDMRVFGRLWYKEPANTFEKIIPTLGELGVEPLEDLTGSHLHKLFKNKKQPVKSALLDQRLIAGVGNIYADESLFRARLHPLTSAGDVTLAQCNRLVAEIISVLNQAIKLGGSSVRDYVDSDGVTGNYQNTAYVYGRKGEPCRVCKTAIERVRIVGRSSHFCPSCQKRKVSR